MNSKIFNLTQPNVTKINPPFQPLPEDEDADPVGKTPGLEEVEEAAERVEHPAKEPVDRTAEHLLQEADLTKAAIPNAEPVR